MNPIHSQLLYTDVNYKYFDTSCEIDNLDLFYLKSINNKTENKIQCIDSKEKYHLQINQ